MRLRVLAPVVLALVVAACGLLADKAVIDGAWVSDDGMRLELIVLTCGARHDPEVAATADEVRITVWYSNESVGDSCADGVTITLEDPLGDRIVIDSATGDVVAVKPWGG